jgi:uncharacterized membrane protein YeiH
MITKEWFLIFDLIGTFVFAVSGAIAARQEKMDLMGMFVLAIVTGVGGGTLRSIFIGDIPPSVFTNPSAFLISLSAVGVAWFAEDHWTKSNNIVTIADAIGLGTFVAAGCIVSLDRGLPWWSCVALGTITASFGGLIRDTLSARVPLIFRKRIYASACILGGLLVIILLAFGINQIITTLACVALVTTIRIISERYDWHLPVPGKKST